MSQFNSIVVFSLHTYNHSMQSSAAARWAHHSLYPPTTRPRHDSSCKLSRPVLAHKYLQESVPCFGCESLSAQPSPRQVVGKAAAEGPRAIANRSRPWISTITRSAEGDWWNGSWEGKEWGVMQMHDLGGKRDLRDAMREECGSDRGSV